jgi:hypothetical protein
MQKLVLEDRRNASKEDNYLIHAFCAALIWHKGLAAEAFAIAEKRRESPSKTLINIWRFAQKLRHFLDEGDLHNAKEQTTGSEETELDVSAALYPGSDSSMRSKVINECLDRVSQLLKMNSVFKSTPVSSTKKMWKAAATLLGLQAKTGSDSDSIGKETTLFSVSKLASTKKWLHETVSTRSIKKRSVCIEESIMSCVKRGPTSQIMYSIIEVREKAAKLRVEGFSAALALFKELSSVDEKTRILIGVSEAMHAYEDVYFASELSGISKASLISLENSWYALSKAISGDCQRWLQECSTSLSISTSTNAKQSSCVRGLLCGLSVAVLDFRPSDAAAIRDSGLLPLLSRASHSPYYALRSLSLKWTELILHRCCILSSALDSDTTLEAHSVSSESKDASDALLPLLLDIFQAKVLDVVESNIPKLPAPVTSDEQPLIQDAEVHVLLKQTLLCSATEPGFVSPHQSVPVNHSFGMWVFRPAEVSDGILFVKGGPVKDANKVQPWSR